MRALVLGLALAAGALCLALVRPAPGEEAEGAHPSLIAQSLSNKQIAVRLGISPRTAGTTERASWNGWVSPIPPSQAGGVD
jgi:hypothetical protein